MFANWINNLNDTGRKVLFGAVAAILIIAAWWAMTDKPSPDTDTDPTADDSSVVVPNPTRTTPASVTPDTEEPTASGPLTVVSTSPVAPRDVEQLARKAAGFAALYQSFRYTDDPAAKIAAIRRQLSRTSQVAPELAVPTGPALSAIRAEKTTVTVTPKRVEVTFIAETTVGFVVDAQVVTMRGSETEEQDRSYSVTYYRTAVGWGVGSFGFDDGTAE